MAKDVEVASLKEKLQESGDRIPQEREVAYSPTLLSTSLRMEPGDVTFDPLISQLVSVSYD